MRQGFPRPTEERQWQHGSMQHDFGGPREASPAELRFLSRLLDLDFRPDSESRVNGRTGRRNANDVWLHHDSSGRPLVSVTRSRIVNGKLAALALRLDYDGSEIRGGWVPESRLLDELDASGPDGIIRVGEPEALADLAGDWFDSHEEARS